MDVRLASELIATCQCLRITRLPACLHLAEPAARSQTQDPLQPSPRLESTALHPLHAAQLLVLMGAQARAPLQADLAQYLPIAETRFFKETQKDSSRSQHSPRQPPAAAPAAVRKYSTPPVYAAPSPSEVASPQHPAQGLPSFGTMPPMMMPMPGPQPMPAASGLPYPAPQPTTPLAGPMHAITLPPVRAPPRTNEARLLGPTSMAHLLHTHGTLPVSRMAPYDEKHKVRLLTQVGYR